MGYQDKIDGKKKKGMIVVQLLISVRHKMSALCIDTIIQYTHFQQLLKKKGLEDFIKV